MIRRLLLAGLLLPCTLQAEQVGPKPIQMPDIRANIMKQLQQGKSEGMMPGEEFEGHDTKPSGSNAVEQKSESSTTPQANTPSGEDDLFSIIDEQDKAARKPASAAVPERPQPTQKSAADVKKQEQHLQLPSKEIRIQDASDLKKLMREFEKARERQQRQ